MYELVRGNVNHGEMSNTEANGVVTGSIFAIFVGGLVGRNAARMVSESFAMWNVTGSNCVGALAGVLLSGYTFRLVALERSRCSGVNLSTEPSPVTFASRYV